MQPEPHSTPDNTLAQTLALLQQTLNPNTIKQAQKQIYIQQNNRQFVSNLLQLAGQQQVAIQYRQACLVAIKNIVSNYYSKKDRLQLGRYGDVGDNGSEMQWEHDGRADGKQIISMICKNIVSIAYRSERMLVPLVSKIVVCIVTKAKIKDLTYLNLNALNIHHNHQQLSYLTIISDICQYYSNSITQSKSLNSILTQQYPTIMQILNASIVSLTSNTNTKQNTVILQCIIKVLQIILYSLCPNFCNIMVSYLEEILLIVLGLLGIGEKMWGNEGQYREQVYLVMELGFGVVASVYKWAYTIVLQTNHAFLSLCSKLIDSQYSKHIITIIGNILQHPLTISSNNTPQIYTTICRCLHSLAVANKQIKQLIVNNSINILMILLSCYAIRDTGEQCQYLMRRGQVEQSRGGLMELLGLLMAEGTGSVIITQILDASRTTRNNPYIVQLPLYIMSRHHEYFIQHIPTLIQNPIGPIINHTNPQPIQLLLKVRSCELISVILPSLPNQYIVQMFRIVMLDISRLLTQIHTLLQSSNTDTNMLDNYAETVISQLQVAVQMGSVIKDYCNSGYGDEYEQMMGKILSVMEVAGKQGITNILPQYNELVSKYNDLIHCTPAVQIPAITIITLPCILLIYNTQLQNILQHHHHHQQQQQYKQQQLTNNIKPVHQLYTSIIYQLAHQNNKQPIHTNVKLCSYIVDFFMQFMDQGIVYSMGRMLESVSAYRVGVVENYLVAVGQGLYTIAETTTTSQASIHKIQQILQLCCNIIPKLSTTTQPIKQQNNTEQQFVFDGDCELVNQYQQSHTNTISIQQQVETEAGISSISDSMRSVVMAVVGNILAIFCVCSKQRIRNYQQQVEQLYINILIDRPASYPATIKQKIIAVQILQLLALSSAISNQHITLLFNKLLPATPSNPQHQLLLCCIMVANHQILQHIDVGLFMQVLVDSHGWDQLHASWLAQCACIILSYVYINGNNPQSQVVRQLGNKLNRYLQSPNYQQKVLCGQKLSHKTEQQQHPLILSLTHTPIAKSLLKQPKHTLKHAPLEITIVGASQIAGRGQGATKLQVEYGDILRLLKK